MFGLNSLVGNPEITIARLRILSLLTIKFQTKEFPYIPVKIRQNEDLSNIFSVHKTLIAQVHESGCSWRPPVEEKLTPCPEMRGAGRFPCAVVATQVVQKSLAICCNQKH
ncbi:hypothetical protein SAY86_030877 [Trapa natans]|uniref:Uncharacterized protein n=1 Tax=Trapa natans TaxID=22666 RepID=A0AAN7M3M3_TRANT|nr:hypothetical protein SAY86_030877 [Trapa natans]